MLIEDLTRETHLSPERLREISENSSGFYRAYYIKKRSGGKRMICEPQEVLKRVQRALVKLVFSPYPVSKYAMAFEPGCSVRDNAEAHRKSKHLLHLDIKDFFPSVSFLHVYQLLAKRYADRDIDLIWKLCSYEKGLPIGAPSSPAICNRIMFALDKQLARKAHGLRYTRYADDLIFSGKRYIKPAFVNKAEAVLERAGFALAAKKTQFMGSGTRKKVTGLILTDAQTLSVGTDYKLRLKHDLYEYRCHRGGDANNLAGRLAYLASVEPAYAARLREKYRFQG